MLLWQTLLIKLQKFFAGHWQSEVDGLSWRMSIGKPGWRVVMTIADGAPAISDETAVSPLRMIGKFEILGTLGVGGMGVVHLAKDGVLNRHVAIKVMKPFGGGDNEPEWQETQARFLREASAAARLNHPNIVTIHDFGTIGDRPFLVMEYLEGDTLSSIIKGRDAPNLEQVKSITLQLCSALKAVHEVGMIHRDLKPSNVMIGKDGQVKLMDFGIVNFIDSHFTTTGALIGTPNYMSPEQIHGKKIDQRSDLFSLGVLVYELLTGERAFTGNSLSSVAYRILHEAPVPVARVVPNLPPIWEAFLGRCLAKNREDRFAGAAEAAQFLASRAELAHAQEPHGKSIVELRAKIKRIGVMNSDANTTLACITFGFSFFWIARHVYRKFLADLTEIKGGFSASLADMNAARYWTHRAADLCVIGGSFLFFGAICFFLTLPMESESAIRSAIVLIAWAMGTAYAGIGIVTMWLWRASTLIDEIVTALQGTDKIDNTGAQPIAHMLRGVLEVLIIAAANMLILYQSIAFVLRFIMEPRTVDFGGIVFVVLSGVMLGLCTMILISDLAKTLIYQTLYRSSKPRPARIGIVLLKSANAVLLVVMPCFVNVKHIIEFAKWFSR